MKSTRSGDCPRSHTEPSVPGWDGLSKWIRHQSTEAGSLRIREGGRKWSIKKAVKKRPTRKSQPQSRTGRVLSRLRLAVTATNLQS